MSSAAEVMLWGRRIGAVSLEDGGPDVAAFQYDPEFVTSGIELSPIVMPLSNTIYMFPELPRPTFHGLPGLLADSLPDKFGNALIDAWLPTEGRAVGSFNAVERLCYTGSRGMGALEFVPSIVRNQSASLRLRWTHSWRGLRKYSRSALASRPASRIRMRSWTSSGSGLRPARREPRQ